jgi:hypothetical protein
MAFRGSSIFGLTGTFSKIMLGPKTGNSLGSPEELKSAVRIPLAPLDVEISSNSTVRRAGNMISRDSEEVMKRTQNK